MNHIRQHLIFLLTLAILLTLAGFVLAADAQQFIVRPVYFQPPDAPEPPSHEIINLLIQTQDFYREEMERHGYGTKTFKLETDGAGNVGFHRVRAKRKAEYYSRDTYNRVKSELPSRFTRTPNSLDNVHIIIIGGVSVLDNKNIGFAWYITGDRTGGNVVLAGNELHFRLIAHEIGHAFGLHHADNPKALMWSGKDILLDYETRWLDRHHLFNNVHIRKGFPRFVESKPIQAIGDDTVRFKIMAESESGLYYAQMSRKRGTFAIGASDIQGESATFEIDVRREYLKDGDSVTVHIMDIHGNQSIERLGSITIPQPIIVDINGDGVVNIQDLVLVAARLGEMWDGPEDVNSDGVVNILDLVLVANTF